MTLRKRRGAQTAPARLKAQSFNPARGPERLVGIGFRYWLAGYDTCDINCWETGWNYYARELGITRAKAAVTELSCWVRLMRTSACRKIGYYPHGCKRFCQDECMAISMVAASQHSICPAMRACAFALLGSSEIDGVVESAGEFGCILLEAGHVLSQNAIWDEGLLARIEPAASHAGGH